MTDDADWGPWVDHDGKGCPCMGEWVQGQHGDGRIDTWKAGTAWCTGRQVTGAAFGPVDHVTSCWSWAVPGNMVHPGHHVIRYRLRKPRALRDLITLAADPYAAPPALAPEGPVRQPEEVPA